MVQIKKKVTLKTKIGQEPVDESVQQQEAQPTLHKKAPQIEATPVSQTGKNGNSGGKTKAIGSMAAIAIVCLLGYGVYTLLSPSDDNNNATTEQVDSNVNTTSNEGDAKDMNDKNSSEVQKTEVTQDNQAANSSENNSPAKEDTTPEASAVQTESKQTTSAEPTGVATKPSKPAIQANASIVSTNQSVALSGTLEQKAKEVIRGNYGNGIERKQKLGSQYDEIQGKVNEMYKNGFVK